MVIVQILGVEVLFTLYIEREANRVRIFPLSAVCILISHLAIGKQLFDEPVVIVQILGVEVLFILYIERETNRVRIVQVSFLYLISQLATRKKCLDVPVVSCSCMGIVELSIAYIEREANTVRRVPLSAVCILISHLAISCVCCIRNSQIRGLACVQDR